MAFPSKRFSVLFLLPLLISGSMATAQDTMSDRVKQLFNRSDKNGDGIIQANEVRFRQAFDRADTNLDGQVTFEEFAATVAQRPEAKPTTNEEPPAGNLDSPFRSAADYLKSRNGHAMLVFHKDELIFEEYFNGWAADKAHRLASGTKSFSGALFAAASEDGLLEIDEPVSKTITEWRDDPKKEDITLRQLLSLTSGLEPGDNGDVLDYSSAIDAKVIDRPGNKFRYGPNAFMIFGEVMKRKLAKDNESPLDYLKRRILTPIGLEFGFWRHTDEGNPHLPSGAFITAREWAKFGLLIQHHGEWHGDQILDPKLLAECFQGSKANPGYGLTFWLGRGEGMPDDLVMAAGAGKQKLYIIPSMDLLIVQLAEAKRYQENEFLKLALAGMKQGNDPKAEKDASLGAPGSHEHQLSHDGRDRIYRLHIPESYDGSKSTPAVFILHGGGGNATQAEKNMGFNPLSDEHGFIAVYPEGIDKHWNDGRESPRFPQAHEADDVDFIRTLVSHLKANLNLDEKRLYVTGHSNGGFMSNRLGWELSDVWAAIAPSAGTLATDLKDAFAPKHRIPVLHIHGSNDKLVPIEGGMVIGKGGLCLSAKDMVEMWARHNRCKQEPEVTDLPKASRDRTSVRRYHYPAGGEGAEVVYYRIENHGHGFAGQTPTRVLTGLATKELDAPSIIWEFFSRHTKSN